MTADQCWSAAAYFYATVASSIDWLLSGESIALQWARGCLTEARNSSASYHRFLAGVLFSPYLRMHSPNCQQYGGLFLSTITFHWVRTQHQKQMITLHKRLVDKWQAHEIERGHPARENYNKNELTQSGSDSHAEQSSVRCRGISMAMIQQFMIFIHDRRIVSLIRKEDDIFELLSSKLLLEPVHSAKIRAAAVLAGACNCSSWMYPHVFEGWGPFQRQTVGCWGHT